MNEITRASADNAASPLSPHDAQRLTDRIRARSEELWHMLLEAYERGAHIALGYSSWGDYFEAEFGGSHKHGYRMLDAAKVVEAIERASVPWDTEQKPNERQARELARLAKEDPAAAAEIWSEVLQEHGEELTASDVKEAVTSRTHPEDEGRKEALGTIGEIFGSVPPLEDEEPWPGKPERSEEEKRFYQISQWMAGLSRLSPEEVAGFADSSDAVERAMYSAGEVIDWFERYLKALEDAKRRPLRAV